MLTFFLKIWTFFPQNSDYNLRILPFFPQNLDFNLKIPTLISEFWLHSHNNNIKNNKVNWTFLLVPSVPSRPPPPTLSAVHKQTLNAIIIYIMSFYHLNQRSVSGWMIVSDRKAKVPQMTTNDVILNIFVSACWPSASCCIVPHPCAIILTTVRV